MARMEPTRVIPYAGARAETRRLFALGWPVAVAYIGTVLMSTVDTVMAGRLGAHALATVALGAMWHIASGIVAFGAARALDPVVAQAFGAGDRREVGLALARGFAMGGLLAIPIIGLLLLARPGLLLFGQPPGLVDGAAAFNLALAPGVPALMGFMVARQYLQALGQMRQATVAILAANLVNVVLNGLLMYGWLGAPRLGTLGCAISTAVGEWVMFGVVLWLSRDVLRSYWPGWRGSVRWRPVGRMLALGVPLGLQFALEVWAFHAAGLMMGRLGDNALAAHQVAINVATLSFMLPNGLAAGAATRVGNLLGAGLPWSRSAWLAVGLGAAMMTVPAALFVFAPRVIVALYSGDAALVGMAATLLPLAGAFQLFDGTQVVCFGVLRGAGDVHLPALANVLGYWLLGLPLGGWLAFRAGAGPRGVWTGLAVALAVVAVTLLARLAWLVRRGGVRIRIGETG